MTALAGQTVLVTGANRGMGREYIGQLLDQIPVLDGIESGADEVLADEMTRAVRAGLGSPLRER